MGEEIRSDATGRGWLHKADDDLRVARAILASDIGVEWVACFHAQQAAEKALKGLLVHLEIDFPRSHSLDRLLSLMPVDVARRFDLDVLIELTPWAVAGRYPEDIESPNVREARLIVDSADLVLAEARGAVGTA